MMSDILRETWAYQEIMKEGELKARHQAILDVIQARFPEIIDLTKKQIDGIVDPELLQDLLVKISLAQNVEAATLTLFAIGKIKRRIDTDHDVPTVID